jgi:tetratricopeptide (TPR) repeat protein
MKFLRLCAPLLAATLLASCDGPASVRGDEPGTHPAPLIDGIGASSFTITTKAPAAQRYFSQGLLLAWAFEYGEAERSFREALRRDPGCAMCEWGLAYVRGPNVNHPYRDRAAEAARHVRRALALAPRASARERALIEALAVRYDVVAAAKAAAPTEAASCTARAGADVDALDVAYAQAMARVAQQFPDDPDIRVLHAEALLLLAPWAWWRGGEPAAGTLQAIEALEAALASAPEHTGANHYLIHALEQSPTPQRALAAAQRLAALAPNAGHLVHMPSHIYLRIGRYVDASHANVEAIAADERFAAQIRAQGATPLAHVSHHRHFLWATAALEGRGAVSIGAARELAAQVGEDGRPFGRAGNEYFAALPLFAWVRFARWDEILAAPVPKGASAYPRGVWHYARGIALARTGRADAAQAELAALEAVADDDSLAELSFKGIDPLDAYLRVGIEALRGEIALARRRYAQALAHLRRAVALEDALESEEPPSWAVPQRHALGAALLMAGRAAEAAEVFREDLARFPANGWALYGLAESLRRQGRRTDALRAQSQFRTAWARADLARPDARY